jgi:eukaryotic-like serine/threonine-protein kinase
MGASSLQPGVLLQGAYVLEDKLGDANGAVYPARRQRDGALVIVRLFPSLPQPLAAEVLELAQLASRVRHPALASVEACGRTDDGCFIVSEYVHGLRLDDWADQVGIPPLGQVIELVRRLCLGLQTAARSGLAHDGINPRNILVPKQAQSPRLPVRLLDLGVPAFVRAPHPQALRFMSPEQLAALTDPERAAHFRCNGTMNVYSCGCLLYYLATGGPPYAGTTVEELRDSQAAGRLALPLRINPQISPVLNTLIVRALALDPAARFPSVAELADALASATGSLQAHAVSVRPAPGLRTTPPPALQTAPEEEEPPTFKTVRPPELRADTAQAATLPVPTIPPATSLPADAAASAPIGLFSSAPPARERRSSLPPSAERSAPLALFSEPPPSASPAGPPSPPFRSPATIIVAEAEPIESRLVRPYRYAASASERGQLQRSRRSGLYWWPLAALACAGSYFAIRSFSHGPRPNAAGEPAAKSGEVARAPNPQPKAAPPAPAAPVVPPAQAPALPEVERTPAAELSRTGAVLPAPAVSEHQRESRERTHARAPTNRSTNAPPRPLAAPAPASAEPRLEPRSGRDRGAAEPAPRYEPSASAESPQPEPAFIPEPEPERENPPHGRPAVVTLMPEKGASSEPAAAKQSKPPKAPEPSASSAPEAPVALAARAEIQGIVVRGSLPTSLVKRALDRLMPQLNACYARAAKAAGRNGFGTLVVEVQIGERGRAQNAHATGGTLPQLDTCVAEATSKLVSEKAPDTGTVSASWKVAFRP